jgi:tetratricopeptide (TPR) repeat protein
VLERLFDMKKIITTIVVFTCLTATAAWGRDAVDFYNLGLNSSLANKRIKYFTKALHLDPYLVDAYEKRGFHYYYQRKYVKVIQDYTKVIELQPDRPMAYVMRGVAFLKRAQYEEAIADFDRAIDLDSQLTRAYGYRAEAYRRQGLVEEALRDASTAIQLRGDPRIIAEAHKTRARAYQELGNDGLADVDFKKSYELDPRYVLFRYLAGTTSLKGMSHMGLMGIVAILFVGIFKVGLQKPQKSDPDDS